MQHPEKKFPQCTLSPADIPLTNKQACRKTNTWYHSRVFFFFFLGGGRGIDQQTLMNDHFH